MNYRHAFHAGNFADVLKHIVLARMLTYLIQKPTPLRYIDTHAGSGWYDLDSDAAARTGEWRNGIGRLDPSRATPGVRALLAPYLEAIGPIDATLRPLAYPGSPAVAQHVLRRSDRLLLCEKHPEEALALQAATKRDNRVKVLGHDGYRSLNAAVPPPERRGLVLIDPPFEDRAEFDAMADAVTMAIRKWPTGSYLLWYPIKDAALVARFHRRMQDLALQRWMSILLQQDPPSQSQGGLQACGLYLVNPPYILRAEADHILPFLVASFAEPGGPPWRSQIQARMV